MGQLRKYKMQIGIILSLVFLMEAMPLCLKSIQQPDNTYNTIVKTFSGAASNQYFRPSKATKAAVFFKQFFYEKTYFESVFSSIIAANMVKIYCCTPIYSNVSLLKFICIFKI